MPLKHSERRRVEVVREFGVLDDPSSQEAFDRIAKLAQRALDAPIAAIGFMDKERLWLKSHVGTPISQVAAGQSFSAYAVASRGTFVVEDALNDPRFKDLANVTGDPCIRSYAGTAILTHDGHALGVICVLDTKPRRFSEEELKILQDYAALVVTQIKFDREIGRLDSLTRLPNRLKLLLDLQSIARRNPGARRTLALVELMGTRHMDETIGALGLDFFNEQIRQAANLIGSRLGDTTVYHLGGAYLAVLLRGEDRDIDARLEEAVAELREPITTGTGIPFTLRPCVGARRIGIEGLTSPDVLRTVLSAARQARASEKTIAWYDAEDDAAHRASFRLLSDFPAALRSSDQLRLVYQPRVDFNSGRCVSVEALLRWNHPSLGPIAPAQFFPLVEKTGLIRQVTDRVMTRAIAQLAAWDRIGLSLRCSVNISVRNLLEDDFVDRLASALGRENVDPARLEVEIVEDIELDGGNVAAERLHRIRELGVCIAIDDFGSGYSNMSYLLSLPATTLKIDRSLISGMRSDRTADVTVSAIIDLSHELGYQVVCEGVEDEETYDLLRRKGADEAQGYLISRPLEVEHVADWIRHGHAIPKRPPNEITATPPRIQNFV